MRWFKHLSMAHDDQGLSTLLEAMGPEAYGIYWLLLEHFASVMEKDCTAVPELVHSEQRWATICHTSSRKFKKFAETSAELKLIESRTSAELKQFTSRMPAERLLICIPKLLKYRDEYSRKSGHSPDKLPARTDTDTDTDADKKKTKVATSAFVLPDWIDRSLWDAYEEMRKKLRKAMTDHARSLAVKDLMDLRNKGHSPSDVLNQSIMRGWTGLFEIKGGTYGTHQGNQSRGNIRYEQQIEELAKAGVTVAPRRAEAGPEQDVPIAGGSNGFGSSGVVLEGVR